MSTVHPWEIKHAIIKGKGRVLMVKPVNLGQTTSLAWALSSSSVKWGDTNISRPRCSSHVPWHSLLQHSQQVHYNLGLSLELPTTVTCLIMFPLLGHRPSLHISVLFYCYFLELPPKQVTGTQILVSKSTFKRTQTKIGNFHKWP